MPGDDVTCRILIKNNGRPINTAVGGDAHQAKLRVGGQITAHSQQKGGSFGAIRLASTVGTRSDHTETTLRQTEQVWITQGFEGDIDTRHHRIEFHSITTWAGRIERVNAEMRSGTAGTA